MNTEEKLCETPTINKEKKLYETPALTVHGSVKDITQSNFKVGSGDAFMLNNDLPDVLGS
jgi:hypothetical protein